MELTFMNCYSNGSDTPYAYYINIFYSICLTQICPILTAQMKPIDMICLMLLFKSEYNIYNSSSRLFHTIFNHKKNKYIRNII